MSDEKRWFASESVISIQQALALSAALIALFVPAVMGWGDLQASIRMLTSRADKTDDSVKSTSTKVDATRETVIEVQTEQRIMGRQLNRIENAVTGRPPREP